MNKLLAACGAAVLALVAVLAWNTFRPLPAPVPAPAGSVPTVSVDAEAAVARFARALSYPTVSHRDSAQNEVAAFAAFRAFLRESFPRSFAALEWQEVNTHSLLGRWPGRAGAGLPAMFIAHYDVVPVDPADDGKWTQPPFAGSVRDGFVWGRGALDDKGNLMALLEATESLLAAGWQPERDIYLGFGHDEEVGGAEGAAGIAALLAARGVRLDFVLDEGGAISLPGMVPGVERPVAVVGIAEKGYLTLELLARASGGHSSTPKADSSILRLARALDALERDPFPQVLDYVHWLADAVVPELSLAPRAVVRNLWLFGPLLAPWLGDLPEINAMTRVTVAPTMLSAGVKDNVQPTEARATVNLRLLPGWSMAAARERVAAIVAAHGVELRVVDGNEASPGPSSLHSDAWEVLARSIRQTRGEPIVVAPFLSMGGTDLKHYYALTGNHYRFGFVPMAPEDFRRVHGIDERLSVTDYLSSVRFFHNALRNAGAR